ncbi:SPOR domain-containing protein [Marinilabilia sp.]
MRKILKYSLLGAIVITQSVLFNTFADKLTHLRTSKKIIPVKEISAPYFAIQILALRKPPQAPGFFKNIDQAREFDCSDGYVRYTVGSYNSADAARQDIPDIKSLGYSECFVVDLRQYKLNGSAYSGGEFTIDKNAVYTIQLAAFRYPVYVSHFEEFDNVLEFYLDDRIYRYTVGKYRGNEAVDELNRVKAMGYPNAHLVLFDKYSSYQIE